MKSRQTGSTADENIENGKSTEMGGGRCPPPPRGDPSQRGWLAGWLEQQGWLPVAKVGLATGGAQS